MRPKKTRYLWIIGSFVLIINVMHDATIRPINPAKRYMLSHDIFHPNHVTTHENTVILTKIAIVPIKAWLMTCSLIKNDIECNMAAMNVVNIRHIITRNHKGMWTRIIINNNAIAHIKYNHIDCLVILDKSGCSLSENIMKKVIINWIVNVL